MKQRILKFLFRARKRLVIWKLKRELSHLKHLLTVEKCPVRRVAMVGPITAKQVEISMVVALHPSQVVGYENT